MLHQPDGVGVVGRGHTYADRGLAEYRALPLVGFGMSVREGECAGLVVVNSGEIGRGHSRPIGGEHVHAEEAVIDGGYGDNVGSTIIDLSGYEPVVIREGKGDPDIF